MKEIGTACKARRGLGEGFYTGSLLVPHNGGSRKRCQEFKVRASVSWAKAVGMSHDLRRHSRLRPFASGSPLGGLIEVQPNLHIELSATSTPFSDPSLEFYGKPKRKTAPNGLGFRKLEQV